jgi:dihydroorotate dehydrogenase (NAD+) catalytic subunit
MNMKRDLIFRTPLLNAAGTLGFAPDPRAPVAWDSFGAFITNPISYRPRTPAAHPRTIEYPRGFLLHTGLPNPGLKAILKKYAPRWKHSDLPIIVNLMADRPEETRLMAQMLENVENVSALELGFAPGLTQEIILLSIESVLGELPLIVSLPGEKVLEWGSAVIHAGAAAISLSAPRGGLPLPESEEEPGVRIVTGRLFGPSLFPQSLLVVREAALLGLPIIGGVGVYDQKDAQAMLQAGASAVQIDSWLWLGDQINASVPKR